MNNVTSEGSYTEYELPGGSDVTALQRHLIYTVKTYMKDGQTYTKDVCSVTDEKFMKCIECHKAISENVERHTHYYMKKQPFCSKTNKSCKDCPVCKELYGEDKEQILEAKKEKDKEIARKNSKNKRREVQKQDWKMPAPQLPARKSQKSK